MTHFPFSLDFGLLLLCANRFHSYDSFKIFMGLPTTGGGFSQAKKN